MAEPFFLNQLVPSGMPFGSVPLSLRVLGQGFLPAAQVLWDGGEVPTLYVGPTELNALVSASPPLPDPPAPVGVAVAVRQTDAGGQTQVSDSRTFTFLVPAPAPVGNRFAPNNVGAPYLRYDIKTDYYKNNGTLQMPIAGPPGTPPAIIQVCAPYSRMEVTFTLERLGADPAPPSPSSTAAGGVLREQWISPVSKVLMSDGLTHLHRMTGKYVYDLLETADETTPLQIGSPPYDLTPPEENIVSPGQYKPGII